MDELLDYYLALPKGNWPEKFIAHAQKEKAEGLKASQAKTAQPAQVGPLLPVARYAGTYADPW